MMLLRPVLEAPSVSIETCVRACMRGRRAQLRRVMLTRRAHFGTFEEMGWDEMKIRKKALAGRLVGKKVAAPLSPHPSKAIAAGSHIEAISKLDLLLIRIGSWRAAVTSWVFR